jgi:hypothetical protein
VRDRSPLLLLQVIDEGRVVLDRDGVWGELRTQRAEIKQQAYREHEALRQRARCSVDELLAATR